MHVQKKKLTDEAKLEAGDNIGSYHVTDLQI